MKPALLSRLLTCPICLEYFKDAVTVAECGHSFCRACLPQCGGKAGGEASCPQCRGIFRRSSLLPNRQLSNFVEIAKKLTSAGEGGEGRFCERHWEPLKLFCADHGAPVCLVCCRSKEHEGHKLVPLEEAARKDEVGTPKHTWLRPSFPLHSKQCKACLSPLSTGLMKKQTKVQKKRATALFRELHQFLERQEELLLAQMQEVEEEITRVKEEIMARFSRELSFYENIIRKVETERSLQPARELLQVREPLLSIPVPGEGEGHSCLGFVGVCTAPGPGPKAAPQGSHCTNITLDPNTAHPQLILSEDLKSVKLGEGPQCLPDSPERFDAQANVLGQEGFMAGRHFWEVIIDHKKEWAVGVAQKTVRRKGEIGLIPEEGVLAMGKWGGDYQFSTPPHSLPLSLGKRLEKIRVSVNCAVGQVSFFDAGRAALLYSEAILSRETLHPFFWLGPKATLRLCP
uniref:Zinc finger protein RFP-like n=1 Tax=Varanus komodoensis TaxID=61221 RepID=A0A8D2J6B9_VARKO